MASVYLKAGRWYLRYKNERGRWQDRVSTARTKTEAARLAAELERRREGRRDGAGDQIGLHVARQFAQHARPPDEPAR